MPENEAEADGRFAYEGLDRVLHEKKRLGILTALVTHPDGLSFADLRMHRVWAQLDPRNTASARPERRPAASRLPFPTIWPISTIPTPRARC